MKRWIKITIPVILVVAMLGFLGWRLTAGGLKKTIKTTPVNYEDVIKDVAFTGSISSKKSAKLSFELSGVLKDRYVEVGDSVTKGQRLALLDPESVDLEVAKTHADTASTTSAQYLAWQKASNDTTQLIQENAKSLEQKRQAVRDAKTALDQSKELFEQRARESGDSSAATLTTQATVVANQAAYNAAKAALSTAEKSSARLEVASKQATDIAYNSYLSATQAAPGDSGLSSLQALSRLAQVKATKTLMRAPFAGVVTAISLEAGELSSPGVPVITIETPDELEFTADVPETDALGLLEGMNATITFDALPDSSMALATLKSIYPAAKNIEGVPTFHVVLTPNEAIPLLRAGLTANITVHAASKGHVLAIPRRVIIRKDGKEFVRIQREENVFEEIEIHTGLAGSNGLIEVTSGLKEGDVLENP